MLGVKLYLIFIVLSSLFIKGYTILIFNSEFLLINIDKKKGQVWIKGVMYLLADKEPELVLKKSALGLLHIKLTIFK